MVFLILNREENYPYSENIVKDFLKVQRQNYSKADVYSKPLSSKEMLQNLTSYITAWKLLLYLKLRH